MKNHTKDSDRGIFCPFCQTPDFDLPGLAYHLGNHCTEYRKNYEEIT